MPIYEYKCNACNHRFEKLRKITDEPLKDCPKCNQPAVTKLVSAAGFKLTGTGWYETDFKNKPKPGKSTESSEPPGKQDSATEKTPEAKDTAKPAKQPAEKKT